MVRQLKVQDAPPNLAAQAAAGGACIRQKYGAAIGWPELNAILQDRSCSPYPCEICFDAQPLLPGECAHSRPKGLNPEEGYTIFVHPAFENQSAQVSYLVLYQLALINHGDLASTDAAEAFGAHALGLSQENYYRALCELADQLGGDELC